MISRSRALALPRGEEDAGESLGVERLVGADARHRSKAFDGLGGAGWSLLAAAHDVELIAHLLPLARVCAQGVASTHISDVFLLTSDDEQWPGGSYESCIFCERAGKDNIHRLVYDTFVLHSHNLAAPQHGRLAVKATLLAVRGVIRIARRRGAFVLAQVTSERCRRRPSRAWEKNPSPAWCTVALPLFLRRNLTALWPPFSPRCSSSRCA